VVLCSVLIIGAGCTTTEKKDMTITEQPFGHTPDGQAVTLYTLSNGSMSFSVMTYGGTVTRLMIPGRDGQLSDVVLGFDSLGGYLGSNPYFGCLVGRYANRIAKGRFTLDGQSYQVTINDGENHLHGGVQGFDKRHWKATPSSGPDSVALTLTYTSADGEQGYPGQVTATVSYVLPRSNEMRIRYQAVTDKPTIVNLTHHGYFNLAGQASGDILGQELQIMAGSYTPVNTVLIPTGAIDPVAGGPMDFTVPRKIGSRIAEVSGGYDHNFVLDRTSSGLEVAAILTDPQSGRKMEVLTTEPGLQFYSGNFLDGTVAGKGGYAYQKHGGVCLEAQRFPDSPNQPSFPGAVLRPGETYTQTTVYRFSTLR